jgi:hypothetical protein
LVDKSSEFFFKIVYVISGRILSESWFLPKIDKAYLKQFSNLQKNQISLPNPVGTYSISQSN